ncbi:hypothetical protein [Natronobacterium texcoconense]|uniref:Uncharacterized protein n=1 Tax=Natronobacterium texcoconense TaxID=1095778 RepID=A0A1H1AY28_NATTX|nr:hypothetical protein [Natronobacterium texcoconense]SDQ44543.1 hypothetical protein SAMN04489842_0850 [Natronobacterium texcoconense]
MSGPGSAIGDATGDATATTLDESDANPPLFLLEHEFGIDIYEATPEAILRIGETDDSHWVVAMADSDDPIETTVTVSDGRKAVSSETVGLSRTSYVALVLRDPVANTVRLEWGENHEWSRSVPTRLIDCNSSNDSLLVDPDGDVERTGETTNQDC